MSNFALDAAAGIIATVVGGIILAVIRGWEVDDFTLSLDSPGCLKAIIRLPLFGAYVTIVTGLAVEVGAMSPLSQIELIGYFFIWLFLVGIGYIWIVLDRNPGDYLSWLR